MNEKNKIRIRKKGVKLPLDRHRVTISCWVSVQGQRYLDKDELHRFVGITHGRVIIAGKRLSETVMEPGQIAFLPRHADCTIRAIEPATVIMFAFEGQLPLDTAALFAELKTGNNRNMQWMPILGPDARICEAMKATLALREMTAVPEFCELKAREMILTAVTVRGEREVARWLMPLIQARDNFQEFVRANHLRANGVAELAQMAGMGLSTFKRRFSLVFGTSVYQWMMKQKADRIREMMEAGNHDIQDLMARFGFQYHSHFNRFCHTYLGEAPSKLVQKIIADNQRVNDDNPPR